MSVTTYTYSAHCKYSRKIRQVAEPSTSTHLITVICHKHGGKLETSHRIGTDSSCPRDKREDDISKRRRGMEVGWLLATGEEDYSLTEGQRLSFPRGARSSLSSSSSDVASSTPDPRFSVINISSIRWIYCGDAFLIATHDDASTPSDHDDTTDS